MNFEDTDFRQEIIDLESPFDVKLVEDFLKELGFDYNPDEVDMTMILLNLNNEFIGTGSVRKKTLKFVAVSPEFRDSTAFAQIVTFLTNKILETYKRCFVFTKPETADRFKSLGFSLIAKAEPIFSVLEFGYETIGNYQEYLRENRVETQTDRIASIVVNCNPFTVGHQYLIEKASAENELVYLFVVSENLSVFPFELRWKMIEKGIAHLKNVKMLSTGSYIVSGAIFPHYFLKQESSSLISEKQAEIDVKIFAKYVAPVLNIKKRYIGTENYCHTTSAYNRAMNRILPKKNIEVHEIERISADTSDNFVSASKVRKAIKEDQLESVLDFLPPITKDFLLSDDSLEIRQKIKKGKGRRH
ncbi:MAG: [citrate (pro-3S)-lyase] ligase [Flavobacteriia bacterium]|nr:MAG: [citrate (pro-3S)-lyase] ligase [Flavobacteriia bacterium]